ncbi:MAG: hypothetical protein OHK0046_20740 [Anaerolineae bacterium]
MLRYFRLSLVLIFSLFTFALLAQETPITFGETITGNITNETPAQRYTFSGNAGDTITIRMNATEGGLDSFVGLLGPAGTELVTDDDSGGNLNAIIGPYILPETGTYTIVATRCCLLEASPEGSSGSYELIVSQAQTLNLAANETVQVALDDSQTSVLFSYDSPGSEIVSVSGDAAAGRAGYVLTARDPNGMEVAQMFGQAEFDAMLEPLYFTQPGIYSIILTRNDTSQGPDAQVAVTLRRADPQPIELGAEVTGTLDDSNPQDYYSFDAQANTFVRLAISRNLDGQDFEALIYGPNTFIANSVTTGFGQTASEGFIDPVQLPVDGQYLLLVRRTNTTGAPTLGTTNYTVSLGETQIPTLESGVEVTDTYTDRDKVYFFNGTEGQQVRFTLRSISESYAPSMNVEAPNTAESTVPAGNGGIGGGGGFFPGNVFLLNISGVRPGTAVYETNLPSTGVYLIRVTNGLFTMEGTQSGGFGLTVEVVG